MASNTSSTSLQVNWREVPFPDQLGIIRGYRVLMWRTNQSSDILRNVTVLIPSQAISFSGLEMYTNYTIQVSAFTVKGAGNKSEPIVVITDEDGKLIIYYYTRWCVMFSKKMLHFEIYRSRLRLLHRLQNCIIFVQNIRISSFIRSRYSMIMQIVLHIRRVADSNTTPGLYLSCNVLQKILRALL